jgi:hypothetical protein
MRTFTKVILMTAVLFTNQMFSQTDHKDEFKQANQLPDRIIPHSIPDEQISHPSESDIFNSKETRTLENKTILDNGFLLIESIEQDWDGSNWVNDWKELYTYDVNNNRIEYLDQEWAGSNWYNVYKQTSTYDTNNNKIEELWQDWDGSNWVNNWKNTHTYDVNNNLIEQFNQTWDGSNWVNSSLLAHTYDVNNNMIELLYQIWAGSNWVNYRKITYTYDTNNNMIEYLSQGWDGSNWVNSWWLTYTYDGNNNRIKELGQTWDGYSWVNEVKSIYSYIPITGIEQLTDGVKTYSLSNNYPNPFNPATSIQFTISSKQFVSLKVYDVLGNEIATLVNEEKSIGSYQIEFDATILSSGVYFYRIQAGSFVESKKMVIIK